jgi:hypothetical protein
MKAENYCCSLVALYYTVLHTVYFYTIYRCPLSVQACVGNYAIITYSDLHGSEYSTAIRFKASYCLYVALLVQWHIHLDYDNLDCFCLFLA